MLFKISDFALYGETLKKAYMTFKTNFYFSMNYLLNCKGDMEGEATIAREKKKKSPDIKGVNLFIHPYHLKFT